MSQNLQGTLKFCPQCRGAVDSDSRFCKYCAYDLLQPPLEFRQGVETTTGSAKSNGKLYIVLGTVGAVALAGILIVGLVLMRRSSTRSSDFNVAPSASSTTMGARAQQIEEKILRGDTLTEKDIAGLSAYELRILRNVHFARYGRKYEKNADLATYFNSRPWYKPRDDYSDSMITANDKANISLIQAAEKSLNSQTDSNSAASTSNANSSEPAPTPASSSSYSSDNGTVTTEKAQRAVDRAMDIIKGKLGNLITPNARARVQGVQELPQQNMAQADVTFLDTVAGSPSCMGLRYRWNHGVATFKRYTDGRWVMTHLNTGEIMCGGTWTFNNLEVR